MRFTVKLLSLLLAFALLMGTTAGLAEEKPVELTIFCTLATNAGIDANNLWWWRYAESRLAQRGYNVKLNVTGAIGDEATQGRALRLGSNNLPDIMWGFTLTGPEIVLYGDGDGMLLDFTPYLNETIMPNAYECSKTNGADAFAASVSPDGKIYGFPYVVDRTLGWLAGSSPNFNLIFVDTTLLEKLNCEMPATRDELLEVLRAAKNYKTEDGGEILPLLATDGGHLNQVVFSYLGFYGADETYGNQPAIKDGAITLPAFTPEYREYLEFFHTLYTEGLISSEYFTMDGQTRQALAKERNFLVYAANVAEISDNPEIFRQYTTLPPIVFDEGVAPVASVTIPYACNRVWASAKTEHPEEVAALLDLLYEDEAMMYYWYGPVLEDPLGIMDEAWQINEDGTDLVHAQVGNGKLYATLNDKQFATISPAGMIGDCSTYTFYAKNVIAGLDFHLSYEEYTDCITGDTVTLTNKSGYIEKYESSVDAYYRLNRYYAWINNLTTVRMSMLYCSEEESERITDLQSVLESYIRENFAQFVTGRRSLDEFDAYQEELKKLGIEELLAIYQEGYQPYMDSVFN